MRAEWTLVCVLLVACGTAARLTRPEGNGGWSPDRRAAEVAAHVDPTVPAAAPPAQPLTLAAALELAAHGNRRVAEAEDRLAESRERVWQTRARLLPSTTGSGRYTWYTDPQVTGVHLPAGTLPAGVSPLVVVREKEFGVANGTVTVPLDLTGELLHALAASQAGYRGERARTWATHLGEDVAVVRAYFQLLEAERLRDVTRETIAVERQHYKTAQDRFSAGRLMKNEVLVADVALRDAEQRLLQDELAIAEARWALNQATGLPVDAPSEVVDVTSPAAVPGADEALRLARANNPAVVELLEEQQQLAETARSLERGWLPRATAGGAIDYSSATIVQPQRVESGFVGLTWDLGTDGRRAAEIAEARIATDRTRIALERQLRELEAAVRTTQQSAEERLTAAKTARVAVVQAEENLRIRRDQFAVGRATSDDVLDASTLLARERAALASAVYQAHTRRAELQELIGLPLDELVAEAR